MATHRQDTIVALATAPGTGAVAIVRLSGPAALEIARAIAGVDPRPRYAELCAFRGATGELLDRGLLLYFPAPRSYTGEDVVELHGHGGRVSSERLLAESYRRGARAAEPGEFTLRAFLNDKVDLLQAEAISDLIASGSERAARAALRSLDGEFSGAVAELQNRVTALRVKIEAWLDFPDEELPFDAAPECADELDGAVTSLRVLLRAAEQGAALRDGLTIAIAGPPNAGKSSLLNRLAGHDAAIVTAIPGTTRDPLREHLTVDGAPVSVIDTAGFRDSTDPIELEGLRRARVEISRADRVLWVVDAATDVDAALAQAVAIAGPNVELTLVRNKIDLTGETPSSLTHGGVAVLSLSALSGAGIEVLQRHLGSVAAPTTEVGGTLGARRRHVDALGRVERHLLAAGGSLQNALELAAEELRRAQAALSELTGELSSDDLLGAIFATFCIGK
jgi:tRNA modification GTPase